MASGGEAPAQRPELPPGAQMIQEGQATILKYGNEVFYNPVQVINRDLSVAVLQYFVNIREEELAAGKLKKLRPWQRQKGGPAYVPEDSKAAPAGDVPCEGIRVLEGLAASGLRSIRYACEVDGIGRIDANDLSEEAVAAIQRNIDYNGGRAAEKVRTSKGDARIIMLQNAGGYDAVDIDPYGSPSHLLDSAVQACSEGGLLLITATDMAVLCGNNGETCFAKYGSYPLHRSYCHEMALRILLASLEVHAARYKRHIVPVLSVSIDFYIRVFVRVYTSAETVKDTPTKLAYVYQSQGCDSFYLQHVGRKKVEGKGKVKRTPGVGPPMPERCPETGAGYIMGGPYWSAPIHDMGWVRGIRAMIQNDAASFPSSKKLLALLTMVSEELPDAPLYYCIDKLAKTCRSTPPAADLLRSAIVNAGYRVSSTHANPQGVKTDCPPHVLWDIMRCWVADHPLVRPPDPVREPQLHKLLSKEPEIKANFSRAADAMSAAKLGGLRRYPPNPTANWGPKPKHGRFVKDAGAQPSHEPEEAAGKAVANGEATASEPDLASSDVANRAEPNLDLAAVPNGAGPNLDPSAVANGGEAGLAASKLSSENPETVNGQVAPVSDAPETVNGGPEGTGGVDQESERRDSAVPMQVDNSVEKAQPVLVGSAR